MAYAFREYITRRLLCLDIAMNSEFRQPPPRHSSLQFSKRSILSNSSTQKNNRESMESVASSVELMNEMDDMIFDLMNNTVEEERVWVYPGEAHGIAKETTLH